MSFVITDTIRDSRTGKAHPMGEMVTVLGSIQDPIRGTLHKVKWNDQSIGLLLPEQIEEK